MPNKIEADASPEKRLFAYLITRDISLADAILDLIDNSINAALQPLAGSLKTADEYQSLSLETDRVADVTIKVTIGSAKISIEDNAHGISLKSAQKDIFRFGRGSEGDHNDDRLSVYGIGLKRAMFKCGNKVHIVSDHADGGFQLNLNTKRWEKLVQEKWSFEIEPRNPVKVGLGTKVAITELYDDVSRRVNDGLFLSQMKDRIARTYSFFLRRVVNIELNGSNVDPDIFEIGENYANERFNSGAVSCNITAGIARSTGDSFRDRNSGWFVFCNGRAVLSAD